MPALAKTEGPKRIHWILAGLAALVAYLFFVHPDVIETANHSYLFLESLFSGRLLHFYEDVMLHENTFYYINFAHYSIVVYLIFGIFELPVFIVCKLFGLAVSEVLLYYIGKLVSALFFAAALLLTARIARLLGLDGATSRWAMLFTLLWPPAFFSCLVMGQYDTICLVFILLGLMNWMQGKMLWFSLWMGLGAACKFFPLLLVVPLVLLAEKKLLPILQYGAVSLWLTLPLSLLYYHRDGDMGFFNQLMAERLFAAKLPLGADVPLFPFLYVVLCVAAYLWNLRDSEDKKRVGLWGCLAVFGLLFLVVDWHPQWLVLLAPFVVLTTFCLKRRFAWWCVDILLGVGFFLWLAFTYPHQLEANLFDYGLLGLATGLTTESAAGMNFVEFYYNALVPVLANFPYVLFAAALACHLIFKLPGKNGTLAGRLSAGGEGAYEKKLPLMLWLAFGIPMAVWLLPTLFTWLKGPGPL